MIFGCIAKKRETISSALFINVKNLIVRFGNSLTAFAETADS